MSLTVEIKTNSMNGLPIRTLERLLRDYDMELIECILWDRLDKDKNYVYQVTMHESVSPKIELRGN